MDFSYNPYFPTAASLKQELFLLLYSLIFEGFFSFWFDDGKENFIAFFFVLNIFCLYSCPFSLNSSENKETGALEISLPKAAFFLGLLWKWGA